MRCWVVIGLMLALLTGTAYAQNSPEWGANEKANAEKAEQIKRDKEIERKYNEVMKRTAPATQVSSDPWQSIRPSAAAGKSKQ